MKYLGRYYRVRLSGSKVYCKQIHLRQNLFHETWVRFSHCNVHWIEHKVKPSKLKTFSFFFPLSLLFVEKHSTSPPIKTSEPIHIPTWCVLVYIRIDIEDGLGGFCVWLLDWVVYHFYIYFRIDSDINFIGATIPPTRPTPTIVWYDW